MLFRSAMPHTYSKGDAFHAINRTALIATAMASQNYEALAGLMDDRIHQPYRENALPEFQKAINSGIRAGAVAGWLSGSGTSIVCLTLGKAQAVAKAMQRQLSGSEVLILAPDASGFSVAKRK